MFHSSIEYFDFFEAHRNTYQGQEWVTTPVGTMMGKGVHEKYMAVTKKMTCQYMIQDLDDSINMT